MKNTGEEIKKRRKALGLTQQDIADKLQCSYVAVGHWENNRNRLNGENLLNLSRILKCSPRDLVDAGRDNEEDILEIEANLIRDAYKKGSPEFQEAARRLFDVAHLLQKKKQKP